VARNIDRKELKNPDQFVTFWTRLATMSASHRKMVIGALVALIVAGLGIWGGSNLVGKRTAENSRAFARIERVANAAPLPATGEAPKGLADDGLPHFKTDKERLEAALKEADAFLAAHGSSPLADEAYLLKAKYLMALNKPADALVIYQTKLGNLDRRLQFLAQEGLGYALEATNQIDQALTAFQALADQSGDGFYKDRALFHKARLLANKGTPKEAEKIYREILEKTPATPLRQEINDRLATLEGK
jgi:tetratricopeptide (TPR) repeat protein